MMQNTLRPIPVGIPFVAVVCVNAGRLYPPTRASRRLLAAENFGDSIGRFEHLANV